MSPVDTQWFTAYAALELWLPITVLDSLSAYWKWVDAGVQRYRCDTTNFPWDQYQDPGVLQCIVQINGLELVHVQDQTPEICLAAVQTHGWALKHVLHQTHEICVAAVRKDARALQFVRDQTDDLCMIAVQQNGDLFYVKNPTPEMRTVAAKVREMWMGW
jgi:hypothetical protein